MKDVVDGTSNTLAVGEIAFEIGGWARGAINSGGGGGGQAFGRAVLRWWVALANCAAPGLNPPVTTCSNSTERLFHFSSMHVGGCHFVLLDGSVRFLSEEMSSTILRGLLTRGGGEVIGEF